jgi:hypothetical protein
MPKSSRSTGSNSPAARIRVLEEGVHWSSQIRPGQYAVFLRDRDTAVALTPDGQIATDPSVTVFESLPEAHAWGVEICAQRPRIRCDIYDSDGLANDPVESLYNPAIRGKYVGPEAGRKRLYVGVTAIFIGSLFIAWDVHRDLLFLWGYIIGLKLVLTGGVSVIQGVAILKDSR